MFVEPWLPEIHSLTCVPNSIHIVYVKYKLHRCTIHVNVEQQQWALRNKLQVANCHWHKIEMRQFVSMKHVESTQIWQVGIMAL